MNNGATWAAANAGLASTSISALIASGSNLFAGAADGTVWRRPLSEMIVSVEKSVNGLPTSFALFQNYPNPFNPGTTIQYTLPKPIRVTLKIYNVLGELIAAPVDERQDAGNHQVRWNASNVPTGIYFYRLQTPEFDETKKMIVLQ